MVDFSPWLRDGAIALTDDGEVDFCDDCPPCGLTANCGPCDYIPESVIALFRDLDGHFNFGNYCDDCDDNATFGNNVPHLLTYRAGQSSPTTHVYQKDFDPVLCSTNNDYISYIRFIIGCEEYWDDANQTGWTFFLAYGGSLEHFQWIWQADATTGNPVASGVGLGFKPPVNNASVNFTCNAGELNWALGVGSGNGSLACAVPTAAPGRAGRASVEWTV